jgi:hypothetical protein
MRATVGILGILGLSVAVASAQAPPSAHPPQRRAVLLPPVAVHPSELPGVARAAAEELSPNPAMTPVVRPGGPAVATAPGWLSGTDSNVRPAAGTGGNPSALRNATPRSAIANEESSVISRGLEKLKGSKSARPELSDRSPGQLPPGVASVTASANTAFRGTGSNGAPVYAGPPAYRWYGWGSVTPGSNPYAPTGQYPPASANWHSITGATPGAFPVPVTHPNRVASGTEPPVYVPTHGQRVAPIWNNQSANMPAHGFARSAEPVTHAMPPREPSRVHQPAAPHATPTPTITQPPPIVLPTITPTPIIVPGTTDQEPPIRPIGTDSEVQPLPVMTPGEAALPTTDPSPLPMSVSDEKSSWQPTTGTNSSGDWTPADGRPKSEAIPPAINWQQGGAGAKTQGQPVVRGQIEESRPDAAVTLIRNLCQGRATGVDVRWTGGEKLRVSFDCRTAAAAQQLVKEICARSELAPLQIEFSVVVK